MSKGYERTNLKNNNLHTQSTYLTWGSNQLSNSDFHSMAVSLHSTNCFSRQCRMKETHLAYQLQLRLLTHKSHRWKNPLTIPSETFRMFSSPEPGYPIVDNEEGTYIRVEPALTSRPTHHNIDIVCYVARLLIYMSVAEDNNDLNAGQSLSLTLV